MGTTEISRKSDLAAAVTRYEGAIEALHGALPELDDAARDALVVLLLDRPALAIELGEAASMYAMWRRHHGYNNGVLK